jgi:hypothetical protein
MWASNADDYPSSTLTMQNDGKVFIRNANGGAIWEHSYAYQSQSLGRTRKVGQRQEGILCRDALFKGAVRIPRHPGDCFGSAEQIFIHGWRKPGNSAITLG